MHLLCRLTPEADHKGALGGTTRDAGARLGYMDDGARV